MLFLVPVQGKKKQVMGNLMAHLGLRIEDQSLVQSISNPLHQLLPDTIFQKLLRIHLKHHSQ